MNLPQELRTLVRRSTSVLGHVVRRQQGERVFRQVETLRREMKDLRSASAARATEVLTRSLDRMLRYRPEEQRAIAHAFALMMELINACENAYRTYRLRGRALPTAGKTTEAILFVLTAHPTEARSVECIRIFRQVQHTLLRSLETPARNLDRELEYLLTLAWQIPMANATQPTVRDEAKHLFSVALGEESLAALRELRRDGMPVRLRTWVGGDKDGHPYVHERTLKSSLQLSRSMLLADVDARLAGWQRQLETLQSASTARGARLARLSRGVVELRAAISKLANLGPRDGQRLTELHRRLRRHRDRARKLLGVAPRELDDVAGTLELFPGLVLPLEIRESADVLEGDGKVVRRMLDTLATLAAGGDPRWYVAGFVISMVERPHHVLPGLRAVKRAFGKPLLPVIPLLENEAALSDAAGLVEAMLAQPEFRRALDGCWGGRFEIMLGYSDSSKEMGAFSSRWMIHRSLTRLDRLCRENGVTPVFFHGTGGSVARGGGSVEEQTQWWPASARRVFKSTLQGEMVHRSFASPEILYRQASGLWAKLAAGGTRPLTRADRELLDRFGTAARGSYQSKTRDPAFLAMVSRATPYRYLRHLRIGSRPVKRGGRLSVESLRAIPWVLCWTQTRVLFPAWWGCGSAWKGLSTRDRNRLRVLFRDDPFVRSFVKLLGFTLSKVELPVWKVLLDASLDRDEADAFHRSFREEYREAVAFVRAVSGERSLLWFRPWLEDSISLRTTMIHPLNLLQIVALERGDNALLRETVTGISSGMLTTG